jgi:hypothetical protein
MPAAVYRPLKLLTALGGTKQLQDLKTNLTLFSETDLKPHMRFYIPNCDIYRTDSEDGHKGGTAVAVKKGIPWTCVDFLSVEATGVCIPIGNTEIFLEVAHKCPQRLWSDTDITSY